MDEDRFYSVREVAERWSVSERTIWRLIAVGDLLSFRLRGQHRIKGFILRRYEQKNSIERNRDRKRRNKAAERERNSKIGLERYEVKVWNEDKPLVRFFANWTIDHSMTIEKLREILEGNSETRKRREP